MASQECLSNCSILFQIKLTQIILQISTKTNGVLDVTALTQNCITLGISYINWLAGILDYYINMWRDSGLGDKYLSPFYTTCLTFTR